MSDKKLESWVKSGLHRALLQSQISRALRDRHLMTPGGGKWVEYILPDRRVVSVEANLRKLYLARVPEEKVVARVVIRPGAFEYTNNLSALLNMGIIDVSGDLTSVYRTADLVGFFVPELGEF